MESRKLKRHLPPASSAKRKSLQSGDCPSSLEDGFKDLAISEPPKRKRSSGDLNPSPPSRSSQVASTTPMAAVCKKKTSECLRKMATAATAASVPSAGIISTSAGACGDSSISTPSTSTQDFSQGVSLEDLQHMLTFYRNKADKQKLKRKTAAERKTAESERPKGVKRKRAGEDGSSGDPLTKRKGSMASKIFDLVDKMALLTIS